MYGNPGYPRKIVQEVIEFINDFIQKVFLSSLKEDIVKTLKENNISSECLSEIEKHFNNHDEIFENVLTEHKRFQLLKK